MNNHPSTTRILIKAYQKIGGDIARDFQAAIAAGKTDCIQEFLVAKVKCNAEELKRSIRTAIDNDHIETADLMLRKITHDSDKKINWGKLLYGLAAVGLTGFVSSLTFGMGLPIMLTFLATSVTAAITGKITKNSGEKSNPVIEELKKLKKEKPAESPPSVSSSTATLIAELGKHPSAAKKPEPIPSVSTTATTPAVDNMEDDSYDESPSQHLDKGKERLSDQPRTLNLKQ